MLKKVTQLIPTESDITDIALFPNQTNPAVLAIVNLTRKSSIWKKIVCYPVTSLSFLYLT